MIITDIDQLKQTSSSATLEEGNVILDQLREQLEVTPGCGISAPQIGVFKRVALVHIKGKPEIPMINPVVKDIYEPCISPQEGCLSFPGKRYDVGRFKYAKVVDDLHPAGFICENEEAIVALHEIDHLDGILFFQRVMKKKEKPGRNDPCPDCQKKGILIKYKKCKEHFKA